MNEEAYKSMSEQFSQLKQTKQKFKNNKIENMAILLYPEVFTQKTLTEYLPSAKISAGYRNQKIISQPP